MIDDGSTTGGVGGGEGQEIEGKQADLLQVGGGSCASVRVCVGVWGCVYVGVCICVRVCMRNCV